MRFITDAKQLTIQLEGLEKLWALKSTLDIPRSSILEVDYTAQRPIMQDFWGHIRIPGTSVPWRFLAGTFWRKGDREFWYIRLTHPGVMTIELKKDAFAYERLRISCSPDTAQDIADWRRRKSKS